MKNYYELLEVDKNASEEIISKVFKLHIKKNHPDLYQGDEKRLAEEKLKELNEAYEVISDKLKRAEYDKKLEDIKNKEEDELKKEVEFLRFELDRKNQIIQILNNKFDLGLEQDGVNEVGDRKIPEKDEFYEKDNRVFNNAVEYYNAPNKNKKEKITFSEVMQKIKKVLEKSAYIAVVILMFWLLVWKVTGTNLLWYIVDLY